MRDSLRDSKTESKLAIGIGIWIVAFGIYDLALVFSRWHPIESYNHPPIHLPIFFTVGVVIILLGIWLIRWGFRQPSTNEDSVRDSPEGLRGIE